MGVVVTGVYFSFSCWLYSASGMVKKVLHKCLGIKVQLNAVKLNHYGDLVQVICCEELNCLGLLSLAYIGHLYVPHQVMVIDITEVGKW